MMMNILIGISLGFLLFKLGELILKKVYKNKLLEARFDKSLLDNEIRQNEIESLM